MDTPKRVVSLSVRHQKFMIQNFLEQGGLVDLWAGWSLVLPTAYYQRNEDGSWSAWGADWTVDVNIIETSGDSLGNPIQPTNLIGMGQKITVTGSGWVGMTEILTELDDNRQVFRYVGKLAAVNTIMSCWISYFSEQQRTFAERLINQIVHRDS